MRYRAFGLNDGQTAHEYTFGEPNKEYTLTLNDSKRPSSASYYIWKLSGGDEVFIKDIESITGRKIKRIYNPYHGNGHGGFNIEFDYSQETT